MSLQTPEESWKWICRGCLEHVVPSEEGRCPRCEGLLLSVNSMAGQMALINRDTDGK
jgi:hypothetical protein